MVSVYNNKHLWWGVTTALKCVYKDTYLVFKMKLDILLTQDSDSSSLSFSYYPETHQSQVVG